MNEIQAKEEIRFIQEMIKKTKQATAESWRFFFTWGIMIIIAIIGNYSLVYLKKFSLIWVNWIVFMGIGVLYTILYAGNRERKLGVKTYAQIAIGHLSFACGIAFILWGFIFPLFGLYSYGVIPVIISMIVGILFFVIGGIYEWNLLKWCAAIWWAGAISMVFIHWHYRALLCIPLIIIGYLDH